MEGVKNYMEEWVEACVNEIIDKFEVCKCERCRKDICALALNNLPPLYVATVKGKIMTGLNTLEKQYEADVLSVVSKAIQRVAKEKHHD